MILSLTDCTLVPPASGPANYGECTNKEIEMRKVDSGSTDLVYLFSVAKHMVAKFKAEEISVHFEGTEKIFTEIFGDKIMQELQTAWSVEKLGKIISLGSACHDDTIENRTPFANMLVNLPNKGDLSGREMLLFLATSTILAAMRDVVIHRRLSEFADLLSQSVHQDQSVHT